MDKKNKIKTGAIYGSLITVFVILKELYFNNGPEAKSILHILLVGIITGILSAFLFIWIIGRFVKSKKITESMNFQADPEETIIYQEGANHFKGIEGVGGMLYLTNQRLVFKSHKVNIQKHELSIPLNEISDYYRRKTIGIVNNGLAIKTPNGKIEKFVVQKPEEWMRQLGEVAGKSVG